MAYRAVQEALTIESYRITLLSTSHLLDLLTNLVEHIVEHYDQYTPERRERNQVLFLQINEVVLDALEEIRTKLNETLNNARSSTEPPAA